MTRARTARMGTLQDSCDDGPRAGPIRIWRLAARPRCPPACLRSGMTEAKWDGRGAGHLCRPWERQELHALPAGFARGAGPSCDREDVAGSSRDVAITTSKTLIELANLDITVAT